MPIASSSAETTTAWGPISVSLFAQILFLFAIVVAWWTKDASLGILLGAASANATTVVNYWLGSSSSSKNKDATIAQMSTTQVVPSVVAP